MSQASRILLFDIDGTLVFTDGAGVRAFNHAFEQLYGLCDALRGVDVQGRSDRWILQSVFAKQRLPYDDGSVAAFLDVYASALTPMLAEKAGRVLPGIPTLLQELQTRDVVIGLGTGNFRHTGLMKLAHYGIADHFVDGGFGEDGVERRAILAAAVERLRPAAATDAAVIVIGDTAHDIIGAHAIGAKAVAVATGLVPPPDLAAAGADRVLPDCADVERALDALLA